MVHSLICLQTKWKGCKCNPPVMSWDNTNTADELQSMQLVLQLSQDIDDHPIQDAAIFCRDVRASAPRKDENAKGATSVEAAVDT